MIKIIKALLVAVPASIFAGALMISVSLGSLFPQVDSIAHPFLAVNGNRIVIEKQDYSYSPGQKGTVVQHVLIDTQGNKKDISFRVGVYSSCIYTLILMFLSIAGALVYRILRHLPLAGLSGTTFWASLLAAGVITALVLLAALGAFVGFLFKAVRSSW